MRFRFSFVLLIAHHLLTGVAKADDPLFSEIAMESVFAKSAVVSSTTATNVGSTNFDRITGPNSLAIALKSADFEPKRNKEAVSISVESAGWNLPVSLTVDVERDSIVCHMSLVKIEKLSSVSGETLLALMTASNRTDEVSFVFDSDEKMLQLRTTLANRDVTTKRLKSQLASLADTAIAHSDTWAKLKTTSTLTSTLNSTAAAAGSTSTDNSSIVGKWSASLPSNASIAIELKGDGTFKMVHLAGNQSAISTGTLLRKSNLLTLSETGKSDVKFQVESVTAKAMKLKILDTSGEPGRSIEFSKASP